MTIYFSATTAGFYDDQLVPFLPEDARPITAQAHRALLDANASGQLIVADGDGNPIAVDPPPPDADALMARLRVERDQRLSASDYLMMDDYPIDADARARWAAYRQALRDLPDTTADLSAINWPEEPTTEGA